MVKSQTPIIVVDNISKVYGKKQNAFKALQNISLSIGRGTSLAIIGKSGSGKSTLMHILACLDKPTSGSVKFDDKIISTLKRAELDLIRNQEFGFVFQQFFMNANDSVVDNVALPLKIAGVKKSIRRKRSLEILKDVGLDDKANSRARDLSGGQKQRVCIARALITNPRVIFADEPTGNLDTNTGDQVENILFNLNKTKGITLVIVTHDDDLAVKCNQQIYLKDGKITPGKVGKK